MPKLTKEQIWAMIPPKGSLVIDGKEYRVLGTAAPKTTSEMRAYVRGFNACRTSIIRKLNKYAA